MRLLSPRELADALGVSESSLKRWVDAGKITAARTDGGHREISLPEAVRFIRETGAPIARPELLDMPEVAAVQARSVVPRGDDGFRHYLLEGAAVGARGWLLSHYLAGRTIAELCDGPVRAAMHRIGELWAHDAEGIFIEHRATDACIQALALTHTRSGAWWRYARSNAATGVSGPRLIARMPAAPSTIAAMNDGNMSGSSSGAPPIAIGARGTGSSVLRRCASAWMHASVARCSMKKPSASCAHSSPIRCIAARTGPSHSSASVRPAR